MPTFAQVASALLPEPGLSGSPEQRIAEGLVNLGQLGDSSVGALDGRGAWLGQLYRALTPTPAYGGGTWPQRIAGGGWPALTELIRSSVEAPIVPLETLAALSLDSLEIAGDQTTGTKVGTIIGGTSGSTITIHEQSNADMFAKDGGDIEVGAAGLDFETAPSPTFTLCETHAGASNSPKFTVIGITVTEPAEAPPAVNLNPDRTFDAPGNQYTQNGGVGTWAIYPDGLAASDVYNRTFTQQGSLLAAVQEAFEPGTDYLARFNMLLWDYGTILVKIGTDGEYADALITGAGEFDVLLTSGSNVDGVWLHPDLATGSSSFITSLDIFEA